jgi:hypothetical protein
MNSTCLADNANQRKRLFGLTERLTPSDLAREMPNGWSVATKLAHLAFWDRYYLSLIEKWERTGYEADPIEIDAVNEAARFLSCAIPPAAAVKLARAGADAIDRRLEAISPELEAVLEASGCVRLLRRAMHRREHLDQIEEALGAAHDK